jgi:hypothetical protein
MLIEATTSSYTFIARHGISSISSGSGVVLMAAGEKLIFAMGGPVAVTLTANFNNISIRLLN